MARSSDGHAANQTRLLTDAVRRLSDEPFRNINDVHSPRDFGGAAVVALRSERPTKDWIGSALAVTCSAAIGANPAVRAVRLVSFIRLGIRPYTGLQKNAQHVLAG